MVRPRARGIEPGPFAWMSEGFCVCGGSPTEGPLGVVVANVDLPVGCAVLDPVWRALVVALAMAVLSPVMAEQGSAGGDSDEWCASRAQAPLRAPDLAPLHPVLGERFADRVGRGEGDLFIHARVLL